MERPDNATIRRMWSDLGPSETARRTGLSKQRVDQIVHRDRALARRAVSRALESGRLARPNRCESCGRRCFPEAHHDDYSQRLAVRWLCRERGCHKSGRDKDWRPRLTVAILSASGATKATARIILADLGYQDSFIPESGLPFAKKERRVCRTCLRWENGVYACGLCGGCRYRSDPEYRARALASTRKSWAKKKGRHD